MKAQKLFVCVSFAISLVACTRQNNETAQVSIQFPGLTGDLSSNISTTAARPLDDSKWSDQNPTTLADIGCFAVFIGSPELNSNYCKNETGTEIARFGKMAGFFARGESAKVELKSGPSHKIYVLGVKLVSGSCEDMKGDSEFTFSNYSVPFILGSASADLKPGEQTIKIIANANFDDDHKLDECSFINKGDNGNNCNGTWSMSDDYDPLPGYDSTAFSVVAGPSGELYTAGKMGTGVSPSNSAWIVKKSSDSGATWTSGIIDNLQTSTPPQSIANAIEIIGGALAVVGFDTRSAEQKWITRSSSNGGVSWSDKDIQPISVGYAYANAIAHDSNGRVYVAGKTGSGASTALLRSAPSLAGAWTTLNTYQFAAAESTSYESVAVDSNNNVWVVGYGYSTSVAIGLIRKTSDLGTTWSTTPFTFEPGMHTLFTDVATYNSDVYVVGYGHDVNDQPRWIVRKTSDGGTNWSTVDIYRYPLGMYSFPESISIDKDSGSIYVAGITTDASGNGHWVVRRGTNNGTSWTTIDDFNPDPNGSSKAEDVTVDSFGNVYVAGSSRTEFGTDRWIVRRLMCQ